MANSPVTASATQNAPVEPVPTSIEPPKVMTNLEQVHCTKAELDKIKINLHKMIDAMAFNPSLLSRAAKYWGEFPLWQKIVAGVVLIAPLLVLGILTQIPVILAISIFVLITYSVVGFLFDNHHSNNINSTQNLKNGISGLADALGVIIEQLETLRLQLAGEIEKFQKENQQLLENVSNLSEEIDILKEQNMLLKATEESLRSTQTDLENTAKTLKLSVADQTRLLEHSQKELAKTASLAQSNQEQLTLKIIELNVLKTAMELKVEQANKIAETLGETVRSLTGTVIKDKGEREAFQKRLDGFLADQGKSFDQIAARIGKDAHELTKVKEELVQSKDALNRSNERYAELLKEGKKQLELMKQIVLKSASTLKPSNVKILGKVGLYPAAPEEQAIKPEHDLKIAITPQCA
jgi:hypothetical protein